MRFKAKTSPENRINFSILAFDKAFINNECSDYFEKNYAILFDPQEPAVEEFEVFRIQKNNSDKRVILWDLTTKFDHISILRSLLDFTLSHKNLFRDKIQIDLRFCDQALVIAPIVQALELSAYDLRLYQTGEKLNPPLSSPAAEITLAGIELKSKKVNQVIQQAQTLAQYQKAVMDLVNAPYNKMSTKEIVSWIKGEGKKNQFKVTVFNKAKAEKTGLHALMAVNRGSESEPAFVIAEYKGNDQEDALTVGLVGKGVTFDTGGLSIKPSNNLHYMKSDMGGAATVLGTICAAAALKYPVNIIAITPITDNSVDAHSIKPGDVINSYSGKTIEIIDTDAEGRLILADALAYMVRNYEVDHLIDLATLTGSCVRTFGSECAGLFSKDDELAEIIFNAGMEVGEKVWALPMWDAYGDEMKSDVADIKNLSTKPVAGAITAAKFLEAFTSDHPSWAHLDIAGVAYGDTKFGKMKSATGWGVHLLSQVVLELNGFTSDS